MLKGAPHNTKRSCLQPALRNGLQAGIAPALPCQQRAAVQQRRVLLQLQRKTLAGWVQAGGDAQVALEAGQEVGVAAGRALKVTQKFIYIYLSTKKISTR